MRSRPGGLRVHIIKKSTNDVVACCVEREPPLKEILPPTKRVVTPLGGVVRDRSRYRDLSQLSAKTLVGKLTEFNLVFFSPPSPARHTQRQPETPRWKELVAVMLPERGKEESWWGWKKTT
ncbi:hypothetical protein RUM43_002683 [Polyplax serrata]|uniref:Uncharacterized protein n=1 Tax=Polyplax serrata TaxID=468196 RepID=A0AAN8S991_POLSC